MAVGVEEARRRIEAAGAANATTLDLSGLRLTEVPAGVAALPGLTELVLRGNRLRVLPAAVTGLAGLTRLDLGDNRLEELPAGLGELTGLRRLSLDGNRLAALPDSFAGLTGLTELALSTNRFRTLPDWFGDLTELTSLTLTGNRFVELPATIGKLTALTSLSLGYTYVVQGAVPAWLRDLTRLTSLKLAGNQFSELPDWFAELTALTALDLGGCGLTAVPDWLPGLTGLTELSLSGNPLGRSPDVLGDLPELAVLDLYSTDLTELPARLADLHALTRLELSFNNLSELPDWLGELGSLTALSVEHNALTELPASLAALTGLTSLRVGYNGLTRLPDSFAGLRRLTTLMLDGNGFTELPAWIGDLTELQVLQLGGCGLTEVPAWVARLTGLTALELHDNALTELPEWLGELTGLTGLRLDGNPLTALPASLAGLGRLRALHLRECRLTELPSWLPRLTGLATLSLDDNPLGDLPEWLGELTELSSLNVRRCGLATLPSGIGRLTGLDDLDLDNNPLTELPAALASLTALTSLWFDNCPVSVLPDWIGELVDLESLSAAYCEIAVLPRSLRTLRQLEVLYLEGNQLTELPAWIAELTWLNTLWLSDNRLTALPAGVCTLTELDSFRLDGNDLRALPADIGALRRLIELRFEGNQLTALPDSIAAMTELTELHVNDNCLTTLPDWLTELPNLTTIAVADNPLVSPPPEIAVAGSASLLAFLRARQRGSSAQWVSKLLVVGEGGVGKTSLVRALAGDPHNPDEPSTHGLMIENLALPHPDHRTVQMRLSAWDFGGQQIYHATHQFFLTNRSLFVLTWNSRHGWEQGKLRYWLDIITARAPESPIVLVATHLADRPVDLPLHELRREYPNIVDSLSVDNETRDGLDVLRARLADEAARLPLMGSEWPTSWLAAAYAVRAAPHKHVTPATMWKLMAAAGVTDPNQQRYIAGALHELGDILYYSDDPELSQTVVLKPGWVNDYISLVLDSREVAESHGLLTRDHLNELWADLDPGLREHFLGMMDKYDLSYRLQGGRVGDLSLVVERLQWDPPDVAAVWDELGARENTREIRVRYRLNTMPPGIPTWFIARSHRFSLGKHWRTGALLGHGDGRHLALVRADRHRNLVELGVRGPTPAAFFSLLDDGLNLTLQRFPGLRITCEVPCPCAEDGSCAELFDHEDLHRRLARTPPKYTIECRKSGAEVSVTQLLFGLAPAERDSARTNIEQLLTRISTQLDTQGDYVQRSFLKVQRQLQAQQEVRCPSVFAIVPARRRRRITGSAFELRLYCEEPGAWHRLPEPAGCYPIVQPAEWFQKLGPHLQHLLVVLRHVTPLAGPVLGVAVDKLDEQVKADCDLMKELVAQLPAELRHRPELTRPDADTGPAARANTEADFRALRAMLTRLDPAENWGGLSRTTTPEGLTLYLCAEHAAGYRRPVSGW